MSLDDFLNGVDTLAIVCNQWGDTGKGKFVDWFAEWADIIARGTGGANAGHTIKIGDAEYIMNLVPSGILHDSAGKINVLGNGVALEAGRLKEELDVLSSNGLPYNGLRISHRAKLVLPHHIVVDILDNGAKAGRKIGSTGRGIGPAYEDHVGRFDLTMNTLLNKDEFVRKLRDSVHRAKLLLSDKDPEKIKGALHDKRAKSGIFYHPKDIFDIDAIVEYYSEHGQFLKPMVTDTDELLRAAHGRKRILLEGAQGLVLSIDYGTLPYGTASDCSVEGLAKGVGLARAPMRVLGIVKAPYMTRVGEGPFPTEFGGERSAEWCVDHRREDEKQAYPHASINSPDEFERGVATRKVGNEYGATTQRARRTGRLDLPLLRHAVKTNGKEVILTKVDVMDDCEKIEICESYRYEGPDYVLADRTLHRGDLLTVATPNVEVLQHCMPVYREFEGWQSKTSDIRRYEDLPKNLRDIIGFIEQSADVNAAIVSVGPERTQTVIRSMR